MREIKAVIFDMYGVIVKDPTGGLSDYISAVSPHTPYDAIYEHWIPASKGLLTSKEFFNNLGFADHAATEADYIDTIEINTDIFAVAAELRKKGIKTAILSNDIAEWNAALRQKHGLNELFDAVTVSGEEGFTKPDRRIYELTLARLGVAPENCVYIDDREYFLDTAEALGMRPILFNSRNVEYDGDIAYKFADILEILQI
ncbi:MAG: HAD family phosphatase [Oscillospiraceae bacterium]|nr:HAD family phosphatase [Oscillospiraceae bacterium]